MITNEDRIELAAKIAAHITAAENNGLIGGRAGVVTAPQVWYLDANDSAQSALVVGFYADNVILCTVGTGRVFMVNKSFVWLDYEEALCESAERQKKRVEEAQAEYLATCNAAARHLREARERKREAKKRLAPHAAE